jgi:hypothetical protein
LGLRRAQDVSRLCKGYGLAKEVGSWESATGDLSSGELGVGSGGEDMGRRFETHADFYLLTPMKPSRSKWRMISCAASSGLNSAVLMTTSASVGGSYGSEIPVKSLRMPARALA